MPLGTEGFPALPAGVRCAGRADGGAEDLVGRADGPNALKGMPGAVRWMLHWDTPKI
jgi:hypothetical protein